jgi:hypothetical protein
MNITKTINDNNSNPLMNQYNNSETLGCPFVFQLLLRMVSISDMWLLLL